MKKITTDKRVAITAVTGIAAFLILLLAMFLSGNEPDAGIIGIALAIILLLAVVAVIKTAKKRTVLYAGAVLGVFMAIAGTALSFVPEFDGQSNAFSVMIVCGIIMIAICAMSLRKPAGSDLRDERSLKIGTWAISYSWYLAFMSVILMFWISYFDLAELTAEAVLGILMLLMPLSAVFFQWYFSKKGDVY
ncbi:putative membrane protein YfcA [Methanomicrobium sp. W14]|uniref:hypothetical protein n=1 Tax=Methanomicrobium sp. W14 TaxID=2817839 RepID=UPI001AE1B4D7|nr:hypothetical protein [Methanomicrobium sp. W14]MBP2133267.1 putative membrane protein YfcA [Methanomicrobium sp. W14]